MKGFRPKRGESKESIELRKKLILEKRKLAVHLYGIGMKEPDKLTPRMMEKRAKITARRKEMKNA
jgi:hypothetical protein